MLSKILVALFRCKEHILHAYQASVEWTFAGAKACMNCNVQRKHCRDLTEARRKKQADVTGINNPTTVDDEI